MKIRDIEDMLKTTFEDKNGNKVITRRIRDNDAILHLEDKFVLPIEVKINRINKLVSLMYEYLKKQNDRVPRSVLISKAQERKFSSEDIKNAETVLSNIENIGSVYVDGETLLHWYDMTEKEMEKNRIALAAFDALPE